METMHFFTYKNRGKYKKHYTISKRTLAQLKFYGFLSLKLDIIVYVIIGKKNTATSKRLL